MSGLVTVVVTNYNAGRYLKEAVKSVLDQTYSKWRMIIVDDASSDDSIDKIQGYLTDPRIRLIVNDRNIGQTKSLNRALKHVHTPWMVQLDSDDWFAPHTLEVLVHEAKHSKPDVGLIGANIELVWQDDGDRTVRTRVKQGRAFRDKYKFLLANQSCWPRFYRTEALRKVGGWPTDGPYEGRYIEDLRILYRLIPRYRFRHVNQTLYLHRRHQHNMTSSTKEMEETLRWLVIDTLKRWGGKYEPRFQKVEDYLTVTGLVPTHRARRTSASRQ